MAKAEKATKKAEAPKHLKTLRADLLIAEKGLRDGTLVNPHKIKAIKKDIARLLTKENQKENK